MSARLYPNNLEKLRVRLVSEKGKAKAALKGWALGTVHA